MLVSQLDLFLASITTLGVGFCSVHCCMRSLKRRRLHATHDAWWTGGVLEFALTVPAHVVWGISDMTHDAIEEIELLPTTIAMLLTQQLIGNHSMQIHQDVPELNTDDDSDEEALDVSAIDDDLDELNGLDTLSEAVGVPDHNTQTLWLRRQATKENEEEEDD